MRKKLTYFYSLLITALFLLPWSGMKAETLTVADGSTTNEYVPIYGYYCDTKDLRCQTLYLQSDISALAGKEISGMKFYTTSTSANVSWGAAQFEVKLATVSDADLSSGVLSPSFTTVFSGTISITSQELNITFSEPFAYSGTGSDNNLLLEIYVPTKGDYVHSYFKGVETENQMGLYSYPGWSGTQMEKYYFTPKTTFTYAAASSCAKPTAIDVPEAYITANSAKVTWTGENNTVLEYKKSSDADWTVVASTDATTYHVLTGLDDNSTYDVRVKNVCSKPSGYTSTSFDTPCAKKSLPYTCGFESADGCTTGSGKIPGCWDAVTYTSVSVYPYVYGSSANTGSNCFYFAGGSSSSVVYAILPEFAEDLQNLTLSFYYKNYSTSSSYPQFTVGYFDPENPATFVPVGGALERTSSYTLCERDLKDVPTTVKNIVIRWAGGSYTNNGYLDDIRVIVTPPCKKPSNLEYTATSAHGVTLSWTNGGEETAWKIEYSTTSDFSSNCTTVDADSNPFTITSGMNANTVYYARVKADCGETDGLSDWCNNKVDFRTDCDVVANSELPWSYGFEDVTTGSSVYNIPYCWARTPDDNNIYVQTSTKRSGSKALKIYGGGSSNRVIRFPGFEKPISGLTLDFYYQATSGSSYGTPKVGYVNTSGTFVSLETLSQSSSFTHCEFVYPSSYDDTPAYIAIQYSGGSYDFGNLYIDDITVKVTPSCLTPSSLNCDSKTANTATISWTAGKVGDEAWVVEYSTASNFETSTEVAATTNPYTITGLTAETSYYVRVKTDCGSSEYSDPSDALNFTTACPAQALPFEEDFSGSISCWTMIACTSGTGKDGSAFKFYYNTTPPQYLISPELEASAKAVQVAFDYKVANSFFEESFKVGYSTSTNAISAFTWGTEQTGLTNTSYTNYVETLPVGVKYVAIQYTANDKSALYIDNFSVSVAPTCFAPTINTPTTTPEGATFTWTASSTNNEGYYQYICVASGETPDWDASTKVAKAETNQVVITGKATGTYDFYVRSWCADEDQSSSVSKSFTTAAVTAPTSVAVTSTNNAATATWTAGNVANYQYCIVEKNGSIDWNSPSGSVSTTSVDLSGLTANTEYDFYVRSYCTGNGAYAAASKVTFSTKCDPTIVDATNGYTQNFNSLTAAGQIPECWDNSEGTTTNANYKWSYFATGHEGKCVRFDSYNNTSGRTNVLASPIFNLQVDADLEFYVKNPTGGAYTVQISVNGGARQDVFTNLTGLTDWTKKEVILTSYYDAENPKTIQFFFSGTSNNWNNQAFLYLDDFVITPQACRKPASDPVVNSKTGTTASISWGAGGASNYQFAVALKDEAPVWDANNVVAATSKTIEGLTPLTNYDFYVRTYCDEDNQSDARKVSFQTECADYVTLPFEENFDALAYQTIPACWNNDEGTSSDYYKWKAVMPVNSTNYVQFNSSTNDANATNVLATPVIQLGESNLLTFKCKNPTGGDFKVQIEGEDIAREDLLTGLTGITDWTLKYAAIPAKFNNKKVQLFFCGTSNEGDENAYISLDDIRIKKGVIYDEANTNTFATSDEAIDVVIVRNLLMNGDYNTLCLPFSLSEAQLAEEDCPLNNFKLKVYDYSAVVNDELQIAIAGASSIEAGVPYFAAYQGAAVANKALHLFKDVVISASEAGSKVDGQVTYQGVLNKDVLADQSNNSEPEILYLGAGNKIYWPAVEGGLTIKGFRAYFTVDYSAYAAAPVRPRMSARIVERAEVPTGFEDINAEGTAVKLLENNQVVIIRNGVKYTVQGQKIQ